MGKKKGRVLNGASPRTATNSAVCLLRVGVDLGGLFDLVLSDTFASNMMRSDDFRETRALTMFDLVLVPDVSFGGRSEEHTSELQSRPHLVCRLLLEKKKKVDI